jgi:hypothetical protein
MAQLQWINIGRIMLKIILFCTQTKKSQWVTTLYTWYAITMIIQIQNINRLKFPLELLIIVQLKMKIGTLVLFQRHQILQ